MKCRLQLTCSNVCNVKDSQALLLQVMQVFVCEHVWAILVFEDLCFTKSLRKMFLIFKMLCITHISRCCRMALLLYVSSSQKPFFSWPSTNDSPLCPTLRDSVQNRPYKTVSIRPKFIQPSFWDNLQATVSILRLYSTLYLKVSVNYLLHATVSLLPTPCDLYTRSKYENLLKLFY